MKPVTTKIIKGRGPQSIAPRPALGAEEPARAVRLLPTTGGVLNKKVLEAQARADAMIAEAKAVAERICAEASAVRADAVNAREAARQAGFQEGREAGMASATEYALRLQEWKAAFYTAAEPEILRLVLTIAEKVIGKMVQEHTEAIRAIVRQAIESSLGERIIVRLNPEDYRIVTSEEFAYRDILDRTKRLNFKEDETIAKGGCVVETEVGTIDAQLETQLKAVRKALQ